MSPDRFGSVESRMFGFPFRMVIFLAGLALTVNVVERVLGLSSLGLAYASDISALCLLIVIMCGAFRAVWHCVGKLNRGDPRPSAGVGLWGRVGFMSFWMASTAVLGQVLVFPLPFWATRRIVLASHGWILEARGQPVGSSGGVLRALGRDFIESWTRSSLVCHVGQGHEPPAGSSDVERVMAYLVSLKGFMLTQTAVPHTPRRWSPLLSGLGYCDQMNGVAADVLAKAFPVSQTYCVEDPTTGRAHTFGRVWSNQRVGWLYFDIFGDEVCVFRIGSGDKVEVLAKRHPLTDRWDAPEVARTLQVMYSRTPYGRVLNEYKPTYARTVASKLWRSVKGRTIVPIHPGPYPGPRNIEGFNGPLPDGLARTFLEARLDHLRGDPGSAAALYAEVCRRAERHRATLAEAACLFARRGNRVEGDR